MIYKTDGGYVISSRQVWVPGVYESYSAAHYAFQFSDEVLQRIQDEANKAAGGQGGVITMNALKKAKP